MSVSRKLIVLLIALALGGCSWFGKDDDEESRDPVPLTRIDAELELAKQWEIRIGEKARGKGTRLVPAIVGSRVFAASADGRIVAVQGGSGKAIWEANLKESSGFFGNDKMDLITGGVGVSSDLLFVGTTGGELVAMNQSDGTIVWRSKASSEILASPVAGRDVVVAHAIDGTIAGYDILDGTRRWIYSATLPNLSLRGTTTPRIFDDYVVTGFANGRIVVLDIDQGVPRFDQRVANAQGSSELERLVDIDGSLVLTPDSLYAVSYQGNLTAIDLVAGKLRWAREASSLAGLADGFGNIYIVHEDGRVGAIDMENSRDVWEVDALKYRDLSVPVTVSSYLAIGDYDGYLHLIAQSDGRFVGRQKVDSEPMRAPAVVDGTRVYVQGSSGRLAAYDLQSIE